MKSTVGKRSSDLENPSGGGSPVPKVGNYGSGVGNDGNGSGNSPSVIGAATLIEMYPAMVGHLVNLPISEIAGDGKGIRVFALTARHMRGILSQTQDALEGTSWQRWAIAFNVAGKPSQAAIVALASYEAHCARKWPVFEINGDEPVRTGTVTRTTPAIAFDAWILILKAEFEHMAQAQREQMGASSPESHPPGAVTDLDAALGIALAQTQDLSGGANLDLGDTNATVRGDWGAFGQQDAAWLNLMKQQAAAAGAQAGAAVEYAFQAGFVGARQAVRAQTISPVQPEMPGKSPDGSTSPLSP